MATAENFWMRRPVFVAMQYNGEQDLDDLRAWIATLDTQASETVVTRIEPLGDGGFQLYQAWMWDNPGSEFVGQRGYPTDWVILYYGNIQIFTNEQFVHDYEPVVEGA